MRYIGNCQMQGCGRKNTPRLPVRVDGRIALICARHGASSAAIYDEIVGERRARIHNDAVGFSVSYMVRVPVGAWVMAGSGRRKFAKIDTAISRARKFLGV